MNAYTGRDGGGELISMGVEHLLEEPLRFAREDPEHFRLTIQALKGWF